MQRLFAAALLAWGCACFAQDYPAKPILLLMPLQAGSAVDVMIRIVAQKMGDNLGRQIVVENQPGAAGVIGAERLKRAAPDGYTIGSLNDSILTMIPNVRPVPYDSVKDFIPISVVASITWVLVASNEVPVKTVGDLVTYAKSRPGKLDYSSGGIGSPQHVAMEAFKAATGVYLVHIPYRGATQAALDVMSNQVQVHFSAVSIVQQHINTGRMRALGVPSDKRSPLLPSLPTIAEAGLPGMEISVWTGLMAPKATPLSIVTKVHADVTRVLALPDTKEKLAVYGLETVGSTPAEYAEFIKVEIARYAKVIKFADIRPE